MKFQIRCSLNKSLSSAKVSCVFWSCPLAQGFNRRLPSSWPVPGTGVTGAGGRQWLMLPAGSAQPGVLSSASALRALLAVGRDNPGCPQCFQSCRSKGPLAVGAGSWLPWRGSAQTSSGSEALPGLGCSSVRVRQCLSLTTGGELVLSILQGCLERERLPEAAPEACDEAGSTWQS